MAFRILILLAVVIGIGSPGAAQVAAPDEAAIRRTIEAQVEAFRRDDGDAAFEYASPAIRGIFGNADTFMDMVRQGYRPVYRPQVFEFREIVTLNGMVTQKVDVIGPDGQPVVAFYTMTRLSDGSWRIEGCHLQAPDNHQA